MVGDYPDTKNSDVIVITAGAQLKAGQDRNSLAAVNTKIVSDIVNECYGYSPEALIILVTNPVDLNCYFAIKNSPYPKHRVISTGTLLDTARFMKILSEKILIDPKNIGGYVLGEHGETASIPWSLVNICGIPLRTYCNENGLPQVDQEEVRKAVVQAGYEIFKRKGNTNHGIAASVFRLIRTVQLNEHSVLPVGCLLEGEYGLDDVVLSVPAVIGRKGIERISS
ncbi:L-lactate dehydrogenase [Pseudobacteriovorax antillogorgiicola]|uniref:L-lactate dehydrogenase n=1 Tax=Pseudobacteriovorax antillogorgiicola TaxID=1513793 RepID=A0A1Y6CQX9_9BACT|nr:L-lactate dehydrogenase [Pseudobacteriovorax antillogorgiicola]SMF84123.1 L-lactate dehydrogenase [Pseudobacteriovorax antillogorgiicola]